MGIMTSMTRTQTPDVRTHETQQRTGMMEDTLAVIGCVMVLKERLNQHVLVRHKSSNAVTRSLSPVP